MENTKRSARSADIVRYAGRILQDNGWTRGQMFTDDKGKNIRFNGEHGFDGTPTKFCLLGALEYACYEMTGRLMSKHSRDLTKQVMAAISSSIREEGFSFYRDPYCCDGGCTPSAVAAWNDGASAGKDQVVKVLMRAADNLEKGAVDAHPERYVARKAEYIKPEDYAIPEFSVQSKGTKYMVPIPKDPFSDLWKAPSPEETKVKVNA